MKVVPIRTTTSQRLTPMPGVNQKDMFEEILRNLAFKLVVLNLIQQNHSSL
jgi:hypothetical protein